LGKNNIYKNTNTLGRIPNKSPLQIITSYINIIHIKNIGIKVIILALQTHHVETQNTKPQLQPIQKPLVWLGVLVAALLLGLIIYKTNGTQGVLFVIGLALGITLLHARFGFTSAFRRLITVNNVQGLQAHMIMLAVASTLFAVILATGFSFTGKSPAGYVSPVGTSLVVGAFIFGIGMQMGSGCASGTLYNIGGGRSYSILTIIGFIVGSVIGAYQLGYWLALPSLPPISFAETTGLGYFGGWLINLAIIALVYFIAVYIARKKNPPMMKPLVTVSGVRKLWRGAWPLLTAGIVLALLNALTLTVRGQPWGVTSAFSLWGSKFLQSFGVDVSSWSYWQDNAAVLHQTVLADSTSVMNFGIILGAFIAAASEGNFKPKTFKPGVAFSSIVGGLLMGYGARLAFGCNIGAYFGGISSLSLHGWVWMVLAILGSFIGVYFRRIFGLSNPSKNDSFC